MHRHDEVLYYHKDWKPGYNKLLAQAIAFLVVALIPPFHIIILSYFWSNFTRYVDTRTCSCSCWDTVFKGPYETGIASYKHFYFNATENTFKIWILIIIFIVVLYECIRYQVRLMQKSLLRYEMAFLFLTSLFSHYYSWWGYINYYNDNFYSQWNHQLFFTITELISTYTVLDLAADGKLISTQKVLTISGIALLHIAAGGWDQFFTNVIRGEGYSHQIVRDICFMIPDILHLIIPPISLRVRSPRLFRLNGKTFKEFSITFFVVSCGFLFSSIL